jgi:adenine phosphoribosyltransferase
MSESLKKKLRIIPDFPKSGINFVDLTTLMKDRGAYRESITLLHDHYRDRPIDVICGVESRGFIFGGALADKLHCGFVPVRKPGKLPADSIKESYTLEYGMAELEIHRDAIEPGARVLVVDDLLATGGTLAATCKLIEALNGEVFGIAVIVELAFLHGREAIKQYDINALITYDSL